jgi:transposase
MRGAEGYTETMFTMAKLDDFVPANHPLQPIRIWLNDALKCMDAVFTRMYESDAKGGRPSIAPEKLIRALPLQVLYSIRSERMLMDQISYNMLFRWFVGLAMDDAVWDHSTFSKNRDRLMSLWVCSTRRWRGRTRVATCRASISAWTISTAC